MNCPNCNEWIGDKDIIETEFYDDMYYDTIIGKCHKCGKKYMWTEVFRFETVIDVKEIAI